MVLWQLDDCPMPISLRHNMQRIKSIYKVLWCAKDKQRDTNSFTYILWHLPFTLFHNIYSNWASVALRKSIIDLDKGVEDLLMALANFIQLWINFSVWEMTWTLLLFC